MKTLLLSLLMVPAITMAADETKPAKPGKGTGATQDEAFAKLDKDSDKKLSLEEFKASPRFSKDVSKADAAFAAKDKDGDKFLSLEEFKARAGGGAKPAAPKTEPPKPETPKTEPAKPTTPKKGA